MARWYKGKFASSIDRRMLCRRPVLRRLLDGAGLIVLFALFGCNGSIGTSPEERRTNSQFALGEGGSLDRSCEKDADQVAAIVAEEVVIDCRAGQPCPCGTHCDRQSKRCSAECVLSEDDFDGCDGERVCNSWGICVDPKATVGDTEVPRLFLQVDSEEIKAPVDGQEFPVVKVAVVLRVDSTQETDLKPRVSLRAGQLGPQESELRVRCTENAEFAKECLLRPDSWMFVSSAKGGGGGDSRRLGSAEKRGEGGCLATAGRLSSGCRSVDGAFVRAKTGAICVGRGVYWCIATRSNWGAGTCIGSCDGGGAWGGYFRCGPDRSRVGG